MFPEKKKKIEKEPNFQKMYFQITNKMIDRTNQLNQCSQLASPIIFMASFSCFSFSIAMNFTVVVQE